MITNSHKITEEPVATLDSRAVELDLEIGNSRMGIGMIMVMACGVGIWGCLCLINGIAQSQSLQDLGRGIFTAFTGL